MKLYKVTKWRDEVEEVEVARATNKSVWLVDAWFGTTGRRRARISSEYSYYDTRAEAVACLRERLRAQVQRHRNKMQDAQKALDELNKRETT